MTNHLEVAKWASKVAEQHNKSITYILMLVHEGQTQFEDLEDIKEYVIRRLVEGFAWI